MTDPITAELGLLDHHCHGVLRRDLDIHQLTAHASESAWPGPPGLRPFDSPFGLAMLRLCPPLLDLDPHPSPEAYLARRLELGWEEVTRRLLRASGTTEFVVETGFPAADIAAPEQMALLADHPAVRVIRLEAIAELVAPRSSAASFLTDAEAELDRQLVGSVGVKTVAAYRFGLDLAAHPPTDVEVVRAADGWLTACASSDHPRLTDRTLISRLVWSAVEREQVIQVHVGFGDADSQLDLADPSKMTPLLRATRTRGARFALLHCYPFIKQAGILAHLFPHVWFDVSCVSHFAGPSVPALIREALQTAPFGKLLYASDAYALPEHYLVSSRLWRRGLGAVLDEWIDDGWLPPAEAARYAQMISSGNARQLYGLGAP